MHGGGLIVNEGESGFLSGMEKSRPHSGLALPCPAINGLDKQGMGVSPMTQLEARDCRGTGILAIELTAFIKVPTIRRCTFWYVECSDAKRSHDQSLWPEPQS